MEVGKGQGGKGLDRERTGYWALTRFVHSGWGVWHLRAGRSQGKTEGKTEGKAEGKTEGKGLWVMGGGGACGTCGRGTARIRLRLRVNWGPCGTRGPGTGGGRPVRPG